MFNKDVEKVVHSKYEKGGNAKILRHLNGCGELRAIERWSKQIQPIGTIATSKLPGPSRTI